MPHSFVHGIARKLDELAIRYPLAPIPTVQVVCDLVVIRWTSNPTADLKEREGQHFTGSLTISTKLTFVEGHWRLGEQFWKESTEMWAGPGPRQRTPVYIRDSWLLMAERFLTQFYPASRFERIL